MLRLLRVLATNFGLASQRGSMATQIVLLSSVMIGFVGLGTEVVGMLMTKRQMQSSADSGALAAAMAINTGYPVAFADEAIAIARMVNLQNGVGGTTIAVNRPPQSGSQAANNKAVEVVITQRQTPAFVRFLSSADFVLHARAVAMITGGNGACVLALDPTASSAISVSGTANVDLNGCGVVANSSSGSAITFAGGATFAASSLVTEGNYTVGNNTHLSLEQPASVNASGAADPYTDRAVPSPGSCSPGGSISKKKKSLAAGTYCGGINIQSSSTVTLNGVYIINGGNFTVSGGSSVSGTATIVLTGSSSVGVVSISGNSTLNLTAPTSGPTAGLVFFQDPKASTSGVNNFSGGGSITLTGALYFPQRTVNYGGGSTSTSTCTQLVARIISFVGNATMQQSCDGVGTTEIAEKTVRLVE